MLFAHAVGELLADSEVDECKLIFAFFSHATANVVWLQVSMWDADLVQCLERDYDLPQHVRCKVASLVGRFDVAFPDLEAVAAVSHEDFAVLFARFVTEELWESFKLAALSDLHI